MRILVIDDADYNCASARLTLKGHDLTVVDNIKLAFRVLDGHPRFDAVLTDLMMPVGDFRGAMDKSAVPPPGGIPAGLVFAFKALNLGFRTVICSDLSHHLDWTCSLLDLLTDKLHPGGGNIVDPVKKAGFVELAIVPMKAVWDPVKKVIVPDADYWQKDVPRIKNWHEVMVESGLFPELEPALHSVGEMQIA